MQYIEIAWRQSGIDRRDMALDPTGARSIALRVAAAADDGVANVNLVEFDTLGERRRHMFRARRGPSGTVEIGR